jgi:hypothetical protein
MPEPQAMASWPGVKFIEDFTGTYSHGVTPSAFRLTIYPQKEMPASMGTLTITYGDYKREFPDCIIAASSHEFNSSGELVSIDILDFRWRWQFGYIAGQYNLRRADFEIVKKDNPKNNDAIEDTERTPQELAELLLKAMHVDEYDISAIPNDARPECNWDYVNPARELAALCESLGCRVVPGHNKKVWICKEGEGKELSSTPAYDSYGLAHDISIKPSSIKCVAAPIMYQADLELEAVALVDDNKWDLLNNVSYKPNGGWNPASVQECTDITGVRNRQLAKESVYRHYRIKNIQSTNNLLKFSTDSREEILPLYNHRGDYIVDAEGNKNYQPPIVYGQFSHVGDAILKNNVVELAKPGTVDIADQTVFDSYSLDVEHGIVKFSNPIMKRDKDNPETGPLTPASLRLRVAVSRRDKKTRVFERYIETKPFGENPDANPLVIKRDDIVKLFKRDNTNNGDEVTTECNYYIEAEEKKLKNKTPQTVYYTEWFDGELDGAIQSITWSFGSQPCQMIVSRNNDHGSPTTESYRARRKDEENKRRRELGFEPDWKIAEIFKVAAK